MPSSKQQPSLKPDEFLGKVVLITGASSGIGEAAALQFARHKAKVIMLVRCLNRGEAACQRIRAECPTADLQLCQADVSLVSSVAKFCLGFDDRVDILVNNAGVFGCPYSQTREGIEYVLAANHVGHFLLTCWLLAADLLNTDARIILVTGAVYSRGNLDPAAWNGWSADSKYSKMQAYSNSKLAVCLFALWLRSAVRQSLGSSAKVFAVHPGVVDTDISRHLLNGCLPPCVACLRCCMRCCMLSPSNGCRGILHCSIDNEAASGSYFNQCRREPWCRHVLDDDLVLRSWDFTFKLVETAATANGRSSEEILVLLDKVANLRSILRDSLEEFLS